LNPLVKEVGKCIVYHSNIGVQLSRQSFQHDAVSQGDENISVELHIVVLGCANHLLSHLPHIHVLLFNILNLFETFLYIFFKLL